MMKLKEKAKKMASTLLSSVLALSTVLGSGAVAPVNVSAAEGLGQIRRSFNDALDSSFNNTFTKRADAYCLSPSTGNIKWVTGNHDPNNSFIAHMDNHDNEDPFVGYKNPGLDAYAGEKKWAGHATYVQSASDFTGNKIWAYYTNVLKDKDGKPVDVLFIATGADFSKDGLNFSNDNEGGLADTDKGRGAIAFSDRVPGQVYMAGFDSVTFHMIFFPSSDPAIKNGNLRADWESKAISIKGYLTCYDLDSKQFIDFDPGSQGVHTGALKYSGFVTKEEGNDWAYTSGWRFGARSGKDLGDANEEPMNGAISVAFDNRQLAFQYGWNVDNDTGRIQYFALTPYALWDINPPETPVLPILPQKVTKAVDKETLNNGDETWTYTISQEIKKIPDKDSYKDREYNYKDFPFTKYIISDQLDKSVVINKSDIKIKSDQKDITAYFDINVSANNKITATLKDPTSKNSNKILTNDYKGGNTISMTVPVSWAPYVDEEIKTSNHTLTDGTNAGKHLNNTETQVVMKNNAQVDANIKFKASTADVTVPEKGSDYYNDYQSRLEAWDGVKTTNTVTTTVAVPKITAPTKSVSDSNETAVTGNTLNNADEHWKYTITQKIPAKVAKIYRYRSFQIQDEIDPCLLVDTANVKVNIDGKNQKDKFDVSLGTNNKLVVKAKSALIDGNDSATFYGNNLAGSTITVEVPVSINPNQSGSVDAVQRLRAHKHFTDDKESALLFKNIASTVVDDRLTTTPNDSDGNSNDTVHTLKTNEVTTRVNVPHLNGPTKTVSRKNGNESSSVTLDHAAEEWTYTITQKIPKNTAKIFRYKSFSIEDSIDKCLTVNKDNITLTIDGKDQKGKFDVSIDGNNKFSAKAKASLLDGNDSPVLYGNDLAGSTIVIKIPVHINPGNAPGGSNGTNIAVLQKIREDKHFQDMPESVLKFDNFAQTVVNDRLFYAPEDTDGNTNNDPNHTFKTKTVEVKVTVPRLEEPEKRVSDTDDLNWDYKVEANGENKLLEKNRLTDTSSVFTYTLTQKIPGYTVPLLYYKSFQFDDAVDSCLAYDTKNVKVTVNGADRTGWFTITKGDDNKLTIKANDAALQNKDFYTNTNKESIDVVVKFPVQIKVDSNALYKSEHLKKDGHLIDTRDGKGYKFLNSATTTINSNLREDASSATPQDVTRQTNEVETQVEAPDYTISKVASRFEWEIGEHVHYTLTVKNTNSFSRGDRVTITDKDLPASLAVDKDTIRVVANGATEGVTADGGNTPVPANRGDITSGCTINYINAPGKKTGNGFEIIVPKQYRGETLTVTYTCEAKEDWDNCDGLGNCSNGSVIPNIANVSSTLMFPDTPPEDEERIWVNTPHLKLIKSTGSYEYKNGKFEQQTADDVDFKVGDDIDYALYIQNEHPGTIARDVEITDNITTDNVYMKQGTIAVYDLRADGTIKRIPDDKLDVTYTLNRRGFVIKTGMNLRYDGNHPFGTDATIKDRVNNKSRELVSDNKIPSLTKRIDPFTGRVVATHTSEWENAHIGFVVTYSAHIDKEPTTGGGITNISTTKAENAEEVKDTKTVFLSGSKLKIVKKSDNDTYNIGDTGHYKLSVTETREDVTAKQVVIEDELANEDATILKDTIKVFLNGKEFTPINIDATEKTIHIETGKDINSDDEIQVKYDVKFGSKRLAGQTVPNLAKAKADNSSAEIGSEAPFSEICEGIQVRKRALPPSGTVVKVGDQIVYTIEVKNTGSAPKYDVLVRDMIPELTTYVKDSASVDSNGGKARTFTYNGKEYVGFVLPVLNAGQTKMMRFTVTVGKDAKSSDIIKNIAQLHDPKLTERSDKDIPDSSFQNEDFVDTNMTAHPLSNWTIDENIVKVIFKPAQVTINKTSDKPGYMVGETGHYTLTAKCTSPDVAAEDVVITDHLENTDAKILTDTIKFYYDDELVKDVEIKDVSEEGYTIVTGMKLPIGHTMKVKYDVSFVSGKLADKDVPNKCRIIISNGPGGGDSHDVPFQPGPEGTQIRKSSIPVPGTVVKAGDKITYRIDIRNSGEKELSNILVKDPIPEFGTYVDGSASNNGKLLTIDGKPVVCMVIPKLAVGDTASVYFDITVNENFTFLDKVKNTAYVRVPTPDELNPDGSVPDESFEKENFKPTNEVIHPGGSGDEDEYIVKIKEETPQLKIEKKSDKTSYNVGDTGKYTVVVSNDNQNVKAKNIVIKDVLRDERAKLQKGTIKVFFNKTEITSDCDISATSVGYFIETHKDISYTDKITVTYDVLFDDATLASQVVPNTAKAKADNAFASVDHDIPLVDVGEGLQARKTCYPLSGKTVKQGDLITYNIDVKNTSEEDKTNVLVRDMIPELTSYVTGSASDNGKILDINGKDYITFVIPKLAAGETKTVSFQVKVSNKATEEDVIKNVAQVYEPKKDELDANGNVPDELFKTGDFKDTNIVRHPLSNWVEDENEVEIIDRHPAISIEKSSDKTVYNIGETGHYTVIVKETREGLTAKQLVIKDKMQDKKALVQIKTIKTYLNNEEFKPVSIDGDTTGYTINTGKDISYTDTVKVTYDVLFQDKTLAGKNVINVAKAKASNAYAQTDLNVEYRTVGDGLEARKKSDPVSGMVVKQGQTITYKIDVRNTSETAKTNVLVRDMIPALTSYVNGSASDGGKVVKVDGKNYIAFVIPSLTSGETKTVSFKVKVSDKAGEDDVIRNVAQVYEPAQNELNKDGSVPDTLFSSDKFKDTNIVRHPLSNWVSDDNTVKVEKPDDPTPNIVIDKKADEDQVKIGDTIHYSISVNQTAKGAKVTNLIVEDKHLTKGVEIDYSSIRVDGKKVSSEKRVTKNASKIHYVTTSEGFKVVYPKFSDASVITFKAKVVSKDLKGKKVHNTATAVSDQTPVVKDKEVVEVPKNPANIVIEKTADRETAKVGEKIKYTIDVTQTVKGAKVTNLIVEDEHLTEGVVIDYNSIRVDGEKVMQAKSVTRDASKIHFVKTDDGFKVVYPSLSDKTRITFTAKVKSKSLRGKKIHNTATAVSDQTEPVKDKAVVKVPGPKKDEPSDDTPSKKKGTTTVTAVKTGDSIMMFVFFIVGITMLLGGVFFVKKKSRA